MLGIAWLADWLPIRVESPETGELADTDIDLAHITGLPGSEVIDAQAATDATPQFPVEEPPADDSIVFSSQSEPGAPRS